VRVVYLPNYDQGLAARVTAGVDLWVNTPRPPQEASGTSGMKAALNGVPSLSVLDGWWLEGHVEGVTGWSIGPRAGPGAPERSDAEDAGELYDKLEGTILPLWAGEPEGWARLARAAIAMNASYFHTQRMLQQYVVTAYRDLP
jgi:starch phosphorylase